MEGSSSVRPLEAETHRRMPRWLCGAQVGRRLLLGFLFFLSLTLFLHFRQVRMEFPEAGSLAPRYIIGQVDFVFPDEDATAILKQEAVRDIGGIYKIDEKQARAFRASVEYDIIHYQKWRQELPTTTFDEINQGLDLIEDYLIEYRFTDRRTLQKMLTLAFPMEHFFPFQSPSDGRATSLSPEFWSRVEKESLSALASTKEAVAYLIKPFQERAWVLEQDFSLEHLVREAMEAKVAQKYTHMEAGSRIIESGEKVTPRHIAMLQAMKSALNKERNLWAPLTLLGSALLALCLIAISLIYLQIFHKELLKSLQKVMLLIAIALMTLVFCKAVEFCLLSQRVNLLEFAQFPILIPLASLLTTLLLGAEISLFFSSFLLVVVGITLAVDRDFFFVVNCIALLVATFCARTLHKRKEIFSACIKVWLSCLPIILAFHFLDNAWNFHFLIDFASSFLFMAAIALLVVGALPLLESIFHVMTDMTLMEYMDPNNDLLRRLNVETPGTYQHSLLVASLAEAGARAIGANGLFCRVSTLYHDIGKLFNPHYFTENQLGGFNIHQLLTPSESAQVIIAHVVEGEALGRRHRLPQSFLDIIREHHGTTRVYCFYCKQVEQMEGDLSKVSEKAFRYPGPKPKTKESAIIMIADTVEAASRSVDEGGEEAMAEMVEKLVREKAQDGQFDECQLTFEELGRVKLAMVKALLVTRHSRVKYPDRIIPKITQELVSELRENSRGSMIANRIVLD